VLLQRGGDPRTLFDVLTPGKIQKPPQQVQAVPMVPLSPPAENIPPPGHFITPPPKAAYGATRIPGVGAPLANPYANVNVTPRATPRAANVLADRTNRG
jgi:hypothetical protein